MIDPQKQDAPGVRQVEESDIAAFGKTTRGARTPTFDEMVVCCGAYKTFDEINEATRDA